MAITHKNGSVWYSGLVLELFRKSHNLGYDDQFFAVVWVWDKLEPLTVTYGSTQDMDSLGAGKIDATNAVKEAYEIYKHNKAKMREYELTKEDCNQIRIGSTVEVTKGRLVPKGTVGTLVRLWYTDYGYKCVIKDTNGVEHKTYTKNLSLHYIPADLYPKRPVLIPFPKASQVLYG